MAEITRRRPEKVRSGFGRFVKKAELAGQLRQLLYAGEISALLERLETALNETTEQQDKESLAKLLGYYMENTAS